MLLKLYRKQLSNIVSISTSLNWKILPISNALTLFVWGEFFFDTQCWADIHLI